jgi:hypothetical protein
VSGEICSDTKTITAMPEATFTFNSYWNTGARGDLPVTLEIKGANGAV